MLSAKKGHKSSWFGGAVYLVYTDRLYSVGERKVWLKSYSWEESSMSEHERQWGRCQEYVFFYRNAARKSRDDMLRTQVLTSVLLGRKQFAARTWVALHLT